MCYSMCTLACGPAWALARALECSDDSVSVCAHACKCAMQISHACSMRACRTYRPICSRTFFPTLLLGLQSDSMSLCFLARGGPYVATSARSWTCERGYESDASQCAWACHAAECWGGVCSRCLQAKTVAHHKISQRVDHGHQWSKVASRGAPRALQNTSTARERHLDLSRSGGARARSAGTCACGEQGKKYTVCK